MRKQYLERGANFDDIPLRPQPTEVFSSYKPKGVWQLCPACSGHGRWNLELNAYGVGKHFQAGCNQCNGYGWVDDAEPRDVSCIHEYRESSRALEIVGHKLHRMEHLWVCKHCKRWMIVDSSG